VWAFGEEPKEVFSVQVPIASFPIELAAPLGEGHAHFINEKGLEVDLVGKEVTSTECKGSAAEPTAEPGNLCVYTRFLSVPTGAVGSGNISGMEGNPGASKAGAILQLVEAGKSQGFGTWAVTAAAE
jgi:hypothetical protein